MMISLRFIFFRKEAILFAVSKAYCPIIFLKTRRQFADEKPAAAGFSVSIVRLLCFFLFRSRRSVRAKFRTRFRQTYPRYYATPCPSARRNFRISPFSADKPQTFLRHPVCYKRAAIQNTRWRLYLRPPSAIFPASTKHPKKRRIPNRGRWKLCFRKN